MKRKTYSKPRTEGNIQSLFLGERIYMLLKKKYPNQTLNELCITCDALCVALLHLAIHDVKESCYQEYIERISEFLKINLLLTKEQL